MGLGPHQPSSPEPAALIVAERENEPLLAYRAGAGDLRCAPLAGRQRLTVGRAEGSDAVLGWDPQVSRAQLECAAGVWMLVDDAGRATACYVNGARAGPRAVGRRVDAALRACTSVLSRAANAHARAALRRPLVQLGATISTVVG